MVQRLTRADGGGGGADAFRGGGQPARPDPRPGAAGDAAEDHHHRHRRARPLRRARRVGARRRCRSSPCAKARWCRARASCVDRVAEPERFLSSADPAVLRGRPAASRARCWCRPRSRTAGCWSEWLSGAAGHAGAHPRPPARREGAAAGHGACATRAARLRPGVAPSAHASRRRSCAALRDLLDLEVEPRRIECFDISNIQGSDIVASMVVLRGRPAARSRTTGSSGSRGWAAPRTTSRPCARWWARRYRRLLEEGKELPDLVLIDGGEGQLSRGHGGPGRARARATSPWPAWPSAEELIFVPGRDEPVALPRASPVLQLVQRVRDEAHRFAIGFHRQAALEAHAALGAGRHPGHRARSSAASSSRASAPCAGCAGPASRTDQRRRPHYGRARIQAFLDRGADPTAPA